MTLTDKQLSQLKQIGFLVNDPSIYLSNEVMRDHLMLLPALIARLEATEERLKRLQGDI